MKIYLICLLALTSCRTSRPVPDFQVLLVPQPTAFPHVFLLTKNDKEMLVDYDSYKDRVVMIAPPDEQKGRTAQWYNHELSQVPVGGVLYTSWFQPTKAFANPRNFTAVIYSPSGRERERFVTSAYFIREYSNTEGQMQYEQGSTDNLTKPVRSGSKVEIIDYTTGRHFWFLLRFPQ